MLRVYLAGVGNSLEHHWQRLWFESDPNGLWLEHNSWTDIQSDKWIAELAVLMEDHREPAVLVCHSLGCLLAVQYERARGMLYVRGALMVAVPDPKTAVFPPTVQGFRSGDEVATQLKCTVVASSNDPYASLAYSQAVAKKWKAEFVDLGQAGHINGESGLGSWRDGQRLLGALEKE